MWVSLTKGSFLRKKFSVFFCFNSEVLGFFFLLLSQSLFLVYSFTVTLLIAGGQLDNLWNIPGFLVVVSTMEYDTVYLQ